jgi:hypothetical protein
VSNETIIPVAYPHRRSGEVFWRERSHRTHVDAHGRSSGARPLRRGRRLVGWLDPSAGGVYSLSLTAIFSSHLEPPHVAEPVILTGEPPCQVLLN